MVHHYKHYPYSVAVYSLIYAEVANMQKNLVRNIEAVAELSASLSASLSPTGILWKWSTTLLEHQ